MSKTPFVQSVFHPTDFSESSLVAFDHALAVTVESEGELTILHAGGDTVGDHPFEHFPAVRGTLQRWGRLEAASPPSAVVDRLNVRIRKISLQQLSPEAAAHRHLDALPTDLVVLATEGRDGLPAWLKPSTAERIARATTSMTLFVQRDVNGFVDRSNGRVTLSRILVPIAQVPAAQPALAAATRLVRLVDTPVEIVLFHVGDDAMPVIAKLQDPQIVFREERGRGNIVDEIERMVREFDTNVVVMTTDGRDGFLGAMGRGSHTERVVRQAACPVLAIPWVVHSHELAGDFRQEASRFEARTPWSTEFSGLTTSRLKTETAKTVRAMLEKLLIGKGDPMKTMVLALSLVVVLAGGSAASAQTMTPDESLKATHELLMQAVKSANVAMVTSVVHPQAFGFFRDSQRLAELKPGVTVADVVAPILTDLSAFTLTRSDTQFRRMGDIGIVAVATIAESKKKSDRNLRSTYVYLRSGDTWKLWSWHTSDLPTKK
jgi:nucleotide-binding universal stress UspA family protein